LAVGLVQDGGVLIRLRRTRVQFPAPWADKNIPADTPLLAAGQFITWNRHAKTIREDWDRSAAIYRARFLVLNNSGIRLYNL
jgi:hypothetical protein